MSMMKIVTSTSWLGTPHLKKMTNEEWVNEQMSDPVIGEVHKYLLDKTLHQRKGKRGDSEALKNC